MTDDGAEFQTARSYYTRCEGCDSHIPTASNYCPDCGLKQDGEPSTPYDVKTVRVHEPERGRYIYVMITRMDGEDHALGEMGFGAVYFQFSVMSQNEDFRLTRMGSYEIKRDHPVEWFPDTNANTLIRGIDHGTVDWNDLADGDHLTAEEVAALTDGDDDE